jgi:sorbitol-specific phosphotransferase system component IIA
MATNIVTEYVNQEAKPDRFNPRWWNETEAEMYKHVFQTVKTLETRQSYRTQANVRNARLYSNLEVLGVYAGLYAPQVTEPVLPNRLSLNIIKSCADTATSKIAKAKPRPIFLTEGGNWEMQERAKLLTKFLDGAFDEMRIYQQKQMSFLDGTVFGTGATKFYKDTIKKTVRCERTVIEELMVDDAEAIYGRPQVMYQKRLVARDVLKAIFKDKKLHPKIDAATNSLNAGVGSDGVKDLVKVIEAWRLPSVPGATDGKHVMVIDTVTLLNEEWDKSYFPFVFDRWNPKLLGFFGMGLAEELVGIQIEINKILRNIQLSMHLYAIPRVMVENNSQINIGALNNDIAAIIRYSGTQPPTFFTPQAMSADVYNHLWNLVSRAYEITGISQLSAASKKPEGLDSGAAIREYQDVESDRFQLVGQRYEDTFLEAARITVDFMTDLDKQFPGQVVVKVSDQGSMKLLKFKEVKMEEDKYIMRMFPTSILPTQPAAKLAKVTELMQAGIFDKETGLDLLDFPDVEAATSKVLAPRRIVFKMLDKIVETKKYSPPEPFMNLDLTAAISQQYYLDAKCKDVPEDRLELLRIFMQDVQTLIDMKKQGAAQAAAPMQPQMGAQPIARPEAAPVSDIMPVGPQQAAPAV